MTGIERAAVEATDMVEASASAASVLGKRHEGAMYEGVQSFSTSKS